jgi:DNA-binding MarR family transcriptional regulator
MSSALVADAAADAVAQTLPQRIARIRRRLLHDISLPVSHTELSILNTLSDGPQRVTALAETEGLAQPTVTLLVQGLAEQGWLSRERDPADGRAVLVHLTDAGRETLGAARAELRQALRVHLAALSTDQVRALAAASEALVPLIEALERRS